MPPRRFLECVELPPPPADKERYTSLSPAKVKVEQADDDVILLGEAIARPKKRKANDARKDEVQTKLEEIAADLEVKLKKKIKVEPTAVVLSEDGVRRRMDKIPQRLFETALTEQQQMRTISRKLFTDHFEGGHNVYTGFDVRGGSLGPTWTRMLCPNRSMNPYTPQLPGANGLFLSADVTLSADSEVETDMDDKDSVDVPTRETTDGHAVEGEDQKAVPHSQLRAILAHIAPGHWRYVGHYHKYDSEPLSADEWQLQSQTFKNAIANEVLTRAGWSDFRKLLWHRKDLRAQLEREPTKEELREKIELLTKRELPGLSSQDVDACFASGELHIDVSALRFIKYLEEFQLELIDITTNPRPRQKKSRPKPKRKPKVETDSKQTENKPNAAKRPRRAASDDSYVDD